MKITFVLPYASLAGGVRVIAIYAKKLVERGHDVFVVSQPARKMTLKKAFRAITRNGRWPTSAGTTPLLGFLGDRHIVLPRSRPVADRDVPDSDVVVATWWETAEWVAALSSEKGKKFYFLQGYEVFPHLSENRVEATYVLPLKKLAVSGYVRDILKEKYGIENIPVLRNSVDLQDFAAPKRERNEVFTVGFLYQTHLSKNTALAIEVIRAAKAEIGEIRVVSFGKMLPRKQDRLPSWVEYHHRPEQADIPGIYASCDAWLFTSTAEGFGLPILEAMACRTPVIATRAGAAPDLIDGSNGFLVESDAEAFVEKIQRLRSMDAGNWQSYSENAHQTATSYSWDDATDLLERFFHEDCPSFTP